MRIFPVLKGTCDMYTADAESIICTENNAQSETASEIIYNIKTPKFLRMPVYQCHYMHPLKIR